MDSSKIPVAHPSNHEVYSGLEVAPQQEGYDGLQAYNTDRKQVYQSPYDDSTPIATKGVVGASGSLEPLSEKGHLIGSGPSSLNSPPPMPWWKRKRVLIPAILMIVVLIAVIPAAVVVSNKNSKSQNNVTNGTAGEAGISGASDQTSDEPVTENAAVSKGTRISMFDSRKDKLFLVYQVDGGGLHYSALSSDRQWQGSTDLNIKDARNNTPIATTYRTDSKDGDWWWIFYVNTDDKIRGVFAEATSGTAEWHPADINRSKYKVPARNDITFTAQRGRVWNKDESTIDGGLVLYACGTDGHVHQYEWNDETSSWSDTFSFEGTTVGCGNAANNDRGGNEFLYTIDDQQTLSVWYNNYRNATDNHWQQGQASPDSTIKNGSACAAYGVMAYQVEDGSIKGSNFTRSRDISKIAWHTQYEIAQESVLDATALACWYWMPDRTTRGSHIASVVYQTAAGALMEAQGFEDMNNSSTPVNWKVRDVPAK